MPFALVTIGLLMIVTGARDTHRCFAMELRSDMTGPPGQNFVWWLAALGGIGALGYVPGMRQIAMTFMALVVIVMVLAQQRAGGGGFFGQFVEALRIGPETIDPNSCTPAGASAGRTTKPAPSSGATDAIGALESTASKLGKQTRDTLLKRIFGGM